MHRCASKQTHQRARLGKLAAQLEPVLRAEVAAAARRKVPLRVARHKLERALEPANAHSARWRRIKRCLRGLGAKTQSKQSSRMHSRIEHTQTQSNAKHSDVTIEYKQNRTTQQSNTINQHVTITI